MLSSAVTTKGQVTVPAEMREKLGIKPGDRVGFVEEDGRLILQPQPQGMAAAFGILKSKKTASLKEIDTVVADKWKRVLALDTNVLVRILIDDPHAAKQCVAARKLASSAGKVYVSQVVQIETVWVLESVYSFARAELAAALDSLLNNQSFVLQEADIFRAALSEFRAGPADFPDYVILMQARAEHVDLATFDRKLSKLAGTRLIAVGAA